MTSDAFSEGARLGHFVIRGPLGAGGMGQVYRAEDERLEREVALKVMPPRLVGHAELRTRFLREAKSAAAIAHPNIVTIFEVGEEGDAIFLAMEMLPGRSLRELFSDGVANGSRLPLADALRIGRQIALALAAAHAKGVVHRDIKPENVMVSPDGIVKVLDFGLAKWRESTALPVGDQPTVAGVDVDAEARTALTAEGRVMGTPGYMSPEQALGAEVDHRTDLFALGVVLFESITGQTAFGGSSAIERLMSTQRHDPPALRTLCDDASVDLDALVKELLSKEPTARPSSAEEVVRRLDAFMNAAPSFATSETSRATDLKAANPIGATDDAIADTVAVATGDLTPAPARDVSAGTATTSPGKHAMTHWGRDSELLGGPGVELRNTKAVKVARVARRYRHPVDRGGRGD